MRSLFLEQRKNSSERLTVSTSRTLTVGRWTYEVEKRKEIGGTSADEAAKPEEDAALDVAVTQLRTDDSGAAGERTLQGTMLRDIWDARSKTNGAANAAEKGGG
jgi:hypothetical protein